MPFAGFKALDDLQGKGDVKQDEYSDAQSAIRQKEKSNAGAIRKSRRFDRLKRFLRKPANEKRRSLLLLWMRHVPGIPVPLRVPGVGWWLARNDFCGQAMVADSFEKRERRLVESVLRPGMTVLDIGAHHGLYSLLASRRVGSRGRVLAFEPSVRERNCLLQHLRLNRCKNVAVQAFALGRDSGPGELFVVEGMETGCNCLRPPNVGEPTTRIAVEVRTLDECLEGLGIHQIDFIKIDVEGAELEVFLGASRLFEHRPRPMILAEAQDMRTMAWGYRSKEVVAFLRQRGYRCFQFSETLRLRPLPEQVGELNDNVVAIPEEKEEMLGQLR